MQVIVSLMSKETMMTLKKRLKNPQARLLREAESCHSQVRVI
jgi:hypothetical protein